MNYVIYEWSVKATDLIVVGTAMTFWVKWGNPEVDFGILNTPSPRIGIGPGGGCMGARLEGEGGR